MTTLPPFAQQDVRLIPKPLWGYSLASLCAPSSWNRIRDEAIASAGGECRYRCLPGRHDGTLEAHERWIYDLNGMVTLQEIWPLCRSCHELFHPGRTLARSGQSGLDRLTRRYAAAAGVERREAQRRYAAAFHAHSIASKIARWTIDTSRVSPHFPLKAKRAKFTSLEHHRWNPYPFAKSVLAGTGA